ncbi:MAG: DUF6702 family protein [Gemmatimonadota bacterium]
MTVASLRRRAAVVGAMLLLAPALLRAHAIHTTLTVLTSTPTGLTLNIRSFADDFSASVARHAGRPVPRDSSVRAEDVTRYVRDRFTVRDAAGRPLILEPCGVRRAGELYWLCFRTVQPTTLGNTILRNQMLTELHADQVNIVQVNDGTARRTRLFTRASAPVSP